MVYQIGYKKLIKILLETFGGYKKTAYLCSAFER